MIYEYWKMKFLFNYTRSSTEMYVNCFGHLGWLFTKREYWIANYAVFEAAVTLLLPVLVGYVYMCLSFRKPKGQVGPSTETTLPNIEEEDTTEQIIGHVMQEGQDIGQKIADTSDKLFEQLEEKSEDIITRTKNTLKIGPNVEPSQFPQSASQEDNESTGTTSLPNTPQPPSSSQGNLNNNSNKDQAINGAEPTEKQDDNMNVITAEKDMGEGDKSCQEEGEHQEAENITNSSCIDGACDTYKICFQTAATRFVNTSGARILAVVVGTVAALHIILILGPLVAYICFFISLALFTNVETVTPWLLPIGMCVMFVGKVFDPAVHFYVTIKDMCFQVVRKVGAKQLFKRDKKTRRITLPRDLFARFYKSHSGDHVHKALSNLISMIGMTYMMIIVTLAMQYPILLQGDSTMAHLSMQIIFILPLIQRLTSQEAPEAGHLAFLRLAIKKHVTAYIKEQEDNPVKEDENVIKKTEDKGEVEDRKDSEEEEEDDDFDEDFDVSVQNTSGEASGGPSLSGMLPSSKLTMTPKP